VTLPAEYRGRLSITRIPINKNLKEIKNGIVY
jgi:hypothetical protein